MKSRIVYIQLVAYNSYGAHSTKDVPHPSEVLTAQEMQEFDDEIAVPVHDSSRSIMI